MKLESEGELAIQQQMVFDRIKSNFDIVRDANHRLESKASIMVAGSAALTGFVTGANVWPGTLDSLTGGEIAAILAFCATGFAMFWYASKMWGPSPLCMPGANDTNLLYDNFITQEIDVAFDHMLTDLSNAIDSARLVNMEKTEAIRSMLTVLQLQIAILAVAVGVRFIF